MEQNKSKLELLKQIMDKIDPSVIERAKNEIKTDELEKEANKIREPLAGLNETFKKLQIDIKELNESIKSQEIQIKALTDESGLSKSIESLEQERNKLVK